MHYKELARRYVPTVRAASKIILALAHIDAGRRRLAARLLPELMEAVNELKKDEVAYKNVSNPTCSICFDVQKYVGPDDNLVDCVCVTTRAAPNKRGG